MSGGELKDSAAAEPCSPPFGGQKERIRGPKKKIRGPETG